MSTTTDHPKRVHEGRNVKRFREILGIKQEALAAELGDEWNQKRISLIESKEKIDYELMTEIAKALKVSADAIRNFDEESAINYITNSYDNSKPIINAGYSNNHYDCTFNPLDKLVEAYEEIKKLHAEKEALYERLLKK